MKLDRHGAPLLADVGAAVFLGEDLLDIAEHHRRRLAVAVSRPLVVVKNAEDIDVLERLGLGPAPVGAGQKIVVDLERLVHQAADFLLARRSAVLLLLRQLQIAAEFAEGFVGGQHHRLQ